MLYVEGRTPARRLYYFTDRRYGLENLTKRRIKVSDFSTLNDSFDMLTPASASRTDRRDARFHVNVMGELFGLLSMSSDWRNPLMWAHYGDRHRGMCIGFDVDPERFRKIDYVQTRPNAASFGQTVFANLSNGPLEALSHTKFSHWSYEQEYRTFIYKREKCEKMGVRSECDGKNTLYFQDFCHWLRPKEILLGERWANNDGHSKDYRDLAHALEGLAPSLSVTKVRSSFHKFTMVEAQDWKLPARVRHALGV